jgi:ribonuclease P protein component
MRQTFRRQERLKSSKTIKQLFTGGHSFLLYPFKVNWLPATHVGRFPARVMISVSKKNYPKASERNHLKRLIREAYRKNKYMLYDYLKEYGLYFDFSLVYIGKSREDQATIERKIILLFQRLISEAEKYSRTKNKII